MKMNLKSTVTLICCFLCVACSKNNDLKLTHKPSYNKELILEISNFPTQYAKIDELRFGKYSANQISEIIFDYLHSIDGGASVLKTIENFEKPLLCNNYNTCKVYIKTKGLDDYGNIQVSNSLYIGSIDLTEFRKFKNSYYWIQKTGGFAKLINMNS